MRHNFFEDNPDLNLVNNDLNRLQEEVRQQGYRISFLEGRMCTVVQKISEIISILQNARYEEIPTEEPRNKRSEAATKRHARERMEKQQQEANE